MVAVVVFFELGACLPEGLAVGQGEVPDVFCEIVQEFLFAYPADVYIPFIPGDVHEVVQVAEHTHLAEFGHPCQQSEPDIPVH